MTDNSKGKTNGKSPSGQAGQAPASAASAREERDAAPPAASMNADAENGGATSAAATPRQMPNDPVKPPLKDAEPHHEVRAGPGDAGQQDAPEPLPKTPRTTKASWARIALWFIVPIAILLVIYTAGLI